MGKSIMAGYFIDLLKIQYPNAIVAYFFCRGNQPGLMSARDIVTCPGFPKACDCYSYIAHHPYSIDLHL